MGFWGFFSLPLMGVMDDFLRVILLPFIVFVYLG